MTSDWDRDAIAEAAGDLLASLLLATLALLAVFGYGWPTPLLLLAGWFLREAGDAALDLVLYTQVRAEETSGEAGERS